MSDVLSRAAIEAADPGGMLGDVLAQPLQLGDALWRVESAAIPRIDLPGGLVVCGMGGSAIGGDLAAAAIGDRATRPLRTVRGYALESWATGDALVLCASYSGETEETLACFEAAGAAGAPRVALTTGGRLAEAARAEDVPVIGVPSGMQPRAAVLYMTLAALECAATCGAAPALHTEIDAAGPQLTELAAEWGPDSPPESEAKRLALSLRGSVPVVYGAGPTTAPARRWKTQLNENAKLPAFFAALPEADHNEICAWERGRALAPLSAVFLDDPDHHPRIRRGVELTAEEAAASGAEVARVAGRGETLVERVLSLVLLGDLVSVYMAVLDGVDPTPVRAIERFKASFG
ncbi:MAG: bifunctional phosphoglucose/phosphomannose isomerase [Thermoleophilaceae bacterium]